MFHGYEDLDLNDEDPEVLVDLLAALLELPDNQPTVEDDDITAVILGRLERTGHGRRPEPTLAEVTVTLLENQLAPALTERPGVFGASEVAVPRLEPLGYKSTARTEVAVDPGGTADVNITLYPAGDRTARLRTTITTPSGSAHTVVIEDDGTGSLEGIAVPVAGPIRLHLAWHYR
jgi:hypothetical protein